MVAYNCIPQFFWTCSLNPQVLGSCQYAFSYFSFKISFCVIVLYNIFITRRLVLHLCDPYLCGKDFVCNCYTKYDLIPSIPHYPHHYSKLKTIDAFLSPQSQIKMKIVGTSPLYPKLNLQVESGDVPSGFGFYCGGCFCH